VVVLELQRRLERNGARADAVHAARIGLRLALARGARGVARLLLADLRRLQGLLRKPQLVTAAIAAGQAEVAALDDAAALAGDGDVGERLAAIRAALAEEDQQEEEGSPEHTFDLLEAGLVLAPESELRHTMILHRAHLLRELGRPEQTIADLRALLAASGSERDDDDAPSPRDRALYQLAAALLANDDHTAFEALLTAQLADAAAVHPQVHRELLWLRGRSLHERGLLEAAIANDRQMLDRDPDDLQARLRLSALHRTRGDWSAALAELDLLVTALQPGPADWDRMTAATVIGAWAKVRDSAARLEIGLPDSDDPDEPVLLDPGPGLGLLRCEFTEADGSRRRYWARRNSPCAARIIEIAFPDDPQHFGDQVVFEPVNLEPQDDDEHRPPCFEVVAVLSPGGWHSFLLRGFDPGAEAVDALEEALGAGGFAFERISAEGRSAADPRRPDDDVSVPTLAALVAVPDDGEDADLRRRLQAVVGSWPLPLLCPALDRAAGDEVAAATALRQLERWNP
ncbi:MAG: hypothetical protein KC457_17225, partial [Myxococcales bacterium]|nr:hypothetical protein [Myxococcales bacterium]